MPRPPLTVAHILPHMAVGGRERMVADLCRDLPAIGIAAHIVTLESLPDGATAVGANAPAYLASDPACLATRLRDTATTVAHIHGHNSAVRAFAAGVGAWPTLVTLHMGMEGSWRWLPAIRAALRRADRLVAVSHPLARLYGRISGCPVEVIMPGVTLPAAPRPPRPDGAAPCFAMLSRLHPVKRHSDAIAACDRLVAAGHRLELHIAGEGPLTDFLAEQAASRPWLHLHGAAADSAAFLAQADVLLQPSLHEGTPLAVMEAMAHGLPVIAARVGGIPALAGDSALLVPPRSPHKLVAAMASLLDNPERAAALGAAGRSRVARWSTAEQATHYTNLYRAIAALHRRAVAA